MTKKTLSVSRMSRKRIARDGHDVGELSRLQRAEPVGEAEELGGGRGAGPESRRRRHAERGPSCVNSSAFRSVRVDCGIGAERDLHSLRERLPEHLIAGVRTRRCAFSATRRGGCSAPRRAARASLRRPSASGRARCRCAFMSVERLVVEEGPVLDRIDALRGSRAYAPSAPCAWAAAFLLSAWASSTSASSSACVSCGALYVVGQRKDSSPCRAGLDDVRPVFDVAADGGADRVGAVGDGVLDPGAPVEEVGPVASRGSQ